MNKLNKNIKGISLAFSQNNNVNEFLYEITNSLENLIVSFSENFDKNFCDDKMIEFIFWVDFDENYKNVFSNCKKKINLNVETFGTIFGLSYINVLVKITNDLSKFDIKKFLEKRCYLYSNYDYCIEDNTNKFNKFLGMFRSFEKRLEQFCVNYNINFQDGALYFATEQVALDQIHNEPLRNLLYKFIESTNFKDRESIMIAISTKIVGLFNEKKESFKILLQSNDPDMQIITKETIKNLYRNLHGYFRRTSIDSNGEEVKKYNSWNEEQKAKVMNQIFYQIIYYLNLLSINDCEELKEIK